MTRLKEMRKSKKMTLAQVAQLIGVTRVSVCVLERKGIRNIDTAKKYAKAFNC